MDFAGAFRSQYADRRLLGLAGDPTGRVRALIAQYNRIVGKRYKWGGGHAKLVDTGYDCSGAVGYGLIEGGLQRTTMVSAASPTGTPQAPGAG